MGSQPIDCAMHSGKETGWTVKLASSRNFVSHAPHAAGGFPL